MVDFVKKRLLMIKLEIFDFHLTGKCRTPAHINFNVNVTQKRSNFFRLYLTISVSMIVIISTEN